MAEEKVTLDYSNTHRLMWSLGKLEGPGLESVEVGRKKLSDTLTMIEGFYGHPIKWDCPGGYGKNPKDLSGVDDEGMLSFYGEIDIDSEKDANGIPICRMIIGVVTIIHHHPIQHSLFIRLEYTDSIETLIQINVCIDSEGMVDADPGQANFVYRTFHEKFDSVAKPEHLSECEWQYSGMKKLRQIIQRGLDNGYDGLDVFEFPSLHIFLYENREYPVVHTIDKVIEKIKNGCMHIYTTQVITNRSTLMELFHMYELNHGIIYIHESPNKTKRIYDLIQYLNEFIFMPYYNHIIFGEERL